MLCLKREIVAITIVKDKEPIYDVENFDVVLVGVSTHNQLYGNFQGKLGIKFPLIEKVYYNTPFGDRRKLGKRITIDDLKPIISLMFMCTVPSRSKEFIDYEALERCLKTANAEFKGKRIIMTMVGSTRFDGKGDKNKCLKIIEENTKDLDVTIYDYEQISLVEEFDRHNAYFKKLKEKYRGNREMIKKIKELNIEMNKRTYVPLRKTKPKGRKYKNDSILNIY